MVKDGHACAFVKEGRNIMNSAQYVNELCENLKKQGMALMQIAWRIALACVAWAYVFGARGQYCTPANRRARYSDEHPTIKTACKNYNGSSSEGCKGCKWFPLEKLTRFFDCRGFTYWVLKLVYGWELMGAGATSQWNTESNWKAKGEIRDGIPQGILCCIFYFKKDSKGKRTKTLQHTGFYFNGETVECSSGVQHSKTLAKKWEDGVWAVPACIETEVGTVTAEPVKTPEEEKAPTLKKGCKGKWVKILQEKLISEGYALPKFGADSDFGNETLNAVKAFQKAKGLTADGVVGEKTWKALDGGLINPAKVDIYTVTITQLNKEQAEAIINEWGGSMKVEG